MNKIAKFEKVSFEQYKKDIKEIKKEILDEEIFNIYEQIQLPKRATIGSAGYDFFSPFPITLKPKETLKIPTGIRVKMAEDWVLQLFPRSGLGFKFRFQLDNTVGIIDSDYYHAINEGHIICKITNDTHDQKTLNIIQGQGFVQGIFLQYGVTIDDEVEEKRIYGFGSTTK